MKLIDPQLSLTAFILLFLLPLLTGAANHLLPLWLFSAQSTDRQQTAKVQLGRWSAVRSMLFLSAGLLQLLGIAWGIIPALLGLLHFLGALIRAVVTNR